MEVQPGCLWKEVVKAKHGTYNHWCTKGYVYGKLLANYGRNSHRIIPQWQLIWRTKLPMKITCYNCLGLTWSMLDPGQPRHKKFSNYKQMRHAQKFSRVNHLLLHCTVANDIWNMFYSTFGLKWVMPQNLKEAVESWSSWKVDKAIRKTMIPASIFWIPQTERNHRCFNGVATPNHSLKAKCVLLLFS